MKLSAKQAQCLFQICKDTLCFYVSNDNPFSFDHAFRLKLVNEIFHQQSDEVKELL